MDVREKLVELIESARFWGSNTSEEIAENLLENGVTVQEWVPVTERLPKDGVRVLVLHDDGVVRIGISRGYFPSVTSKTHTKAFGISEVTHWMPLPQPTKEE